MPLAQPSCAGVSDTRDKSHVTSVVQRTPNRAQINKLLQQFAQQNPNHVVTIAGFASAVRQWAADKQLEQQTESDQGGEYIHTTTEMVPKVIQTAGKRAADADDTTIYDDIVLPIKRMRVDDSEIVHHPIGEYNVTTPPRRIPAFGSSQSGGVHSASLSGFTPINGPRSHDAGLIGSGTISSATDDAIILGSPTEVGPSMLGHQDNPSGLLSSPMPRNLGKDIPTFSSTPGAAQRKSPPSRLNLELPGAAPPKFINEATHYLAFPAYRRCPEVNIWYAQHQLDEEHAKHPGSERITLLKTAIRVLEPNEVELPENFDLPYIIMPIPQTPASALASSFATKFTLATPATAEFSEAARMRLMAAGQRDQFNIIRQIGTPAATGEPSAYHQKRRVRRTDRILGALKNGDGSSMMTLEKLSDGHMETAKHGGFSEKKKRKTPFDLISALSCIPELATAVAFHIPPRDLLTLYSVSVRFHMQINAYLKSSIAHWTREWAPDAAEIYSWEHRSMYKHFAIPDPAGQPLTALPPSPVSWQHDADSLVPSIR